MLDFYQSTHDDPIRIELVKIIAFAMKQNPTVFDKLMYVTSLSDVADVLELPGDLLIMKTRKYMEDRAKTS